jgi:hypothetical protein
MSRPLGRLERPNSEASYARKWTTAGGPRPTLKQRHGEPFAQGRFAIFPPHERHYEGEQAKHGPSI